MFESGKCLIRYQRAVSYLHVYPVHPSGDSTLILLTSARVDSSDSVR